MYPLHSANSSLSSSRFPLRFGFGGSFPSFFSWQFGLCLCCPIIFFLHLCAAVSAVFVFGFSSVSRRSFTTRTPKTAIQTNKFPLPMHHRGYISCGSKPYRTFRFVAFCARASAYVIAVILPVYVFFRHHAPPSVSPAAASSVYTFSDPMRSRNISLGVYHLHPIHYNRDTTVFS